MSKNVVFQVLIICLMSAVYCSAESGSLLSITGAVRQPLHLSMEDLGRYQPVQIQLNEVLSNGGFHGVFTYCGVPLKTLLELASPAKGDTGFPSPIDLAIRVRNKKGDEVALSWGEVFCKNPSEFIVATSARPVNSYKDCTGCHTKNEHKPRLEQYERTPALPKLVVGSDMYADRCIEDISAIEIIDLRPRMATQKLPELFSPAIKITGSVKKEMTVKKLASFTKLDIPFMQGDCRGYHGIQSYGGASLKNILEAAGMRHDINSVLLISAPDGYRALVSFGELFLSRGGERILIADRLNGSSLETGGRFYLVFPDDITVERRVDAVAKIEAVSITGAPKLNVVGVGCGDTNLITLQAISAMAKADAFVCTEDIKKRFGKYMGDKPVLFDMYDYTPHTIKKQNPSLAPNDVQWLIKEKQSHAAWIIKDILNNNKHVVLLDYGDPAIFTGSAWVRDFFEEKELEFIPGISSFTAANALLSKKFDGNRSIVLTTPWDMEANPALMKAAGARGDAVVIFMGLARADSMTPILRECYPGATPAHIVYKAGYAGSEKVITTTLDGLGKTLMEEQEKLLGLIYIEPPLQGGKSQMSGHR